MSWDAKDYAGITAESEYREHLEDCEREREERKAREEEELIAAGLDEPAVIDEEADRRFAAACEGFLASLRVDPVLSAVEGWKRAVSATAERRAA